MTPEQSPRHWLVAPLDTLPGRVRWALVLGLTLLCALLSLAVQRTQESPFLVPDSTFYVEMAQGSIQLVPQPFASRPLAPLLVRALAHGFPRTGAHTGVELGFALLASASLLCTLLVVFWLATRTAAPAWLLLALAAVAFWGQLLHGLALPDPLYAALLACFLLCLAAQRPMLAAAMLFPLMLARDSTLLTFVCLLLAGWRPLRWSCRLLALAATVSGSLVVRRSSAGSAGNPEHLPGFLYLAAKVPWSLARDLGVVPWSNIYPNLCTAPVWQHALHVGPVRSVGICSYSPFAPLQVLFALSTAFGLLPWLLIVVWRRRSPAAGEGAPQKSAAPPSEPHPLAPKPLSLLYRFCVVYGAASFLLAPLIGTSFARLFGYAWPLFLVALPGLFSPTRHRSEPDAGPAPQPTPSNRRGLQTATIAGFLAIHFALAVCVFLPPNLSLIAAVFLLQALGAALVFAARRTLAAPCTPA